MNALVRLIGTVMVGALLASGAATAVAASTAAPAAPAAAATLASGPLGDGGTDWP